MTRFIDVKNAVPDHSDLREIASRTSIGISGCLGGPDLGPMSPILATGAVCLAASCLLPQRLQGFHVR